MSLGLSGLSFGLLLPTLLALWTYSFKTGTPAPDATHIYRLSDHSRSSYILHGQRAAIDVIEMMLASSFLLLAPSILAQQLFERLFPPRTWGYEPFETHQPAQPKHPPGLDYQHP